MFAHIRDLSLRLQWPAWSLLMLSYVMLFYFSIVTIDIIFRKRYKTMAHSWMFLTIFHIFVNEWVYDLDWHRRLHLMLLMIHLTGTCITIRSRQSALVYSATWLLWTICTYWSACVVCATHMWLMIMSQMMKCVCDMKICFGYCSVWWLESSRSVFQLLWVYLF
jgi:hypothetical protein